LAGLEGYQVEDLALPERIIEIKFLEILKISKGYLL